MKKILAIIVSYNFEPWLHQCLNSLLSSTIPVDILVIDNKSTDNTANIIHSTYSNVELIKNTKNLGFGGANNIGLNLCIKRKYDYAFLINQDAWISPNCLEELLKVRGENVGIISPIHLDGTGKQLDLGFETYTKNSVLTDQGFQQVKFINAAFWLIPISTIKKVGVFSSIFHHYGEDVDYGNRLHYNKLSFTFSPVALAYHDRQNRNITYRTFLASELTYYLTEYCNINHSYLIAFAYSIGASFKKSIWSLWKRDQKLSKEYLKICFKLLLKTKAVINTRRKNKALFNNE